MQQKTAEQNKPESFTPFFVVDRQASLKIIAGVSLPDNKKMGLMTHANTHKNFQQAFKKFPCVDLDSCPVIGGKKCPYSGDISKCEKGQKLRSSIITICDSGVFTKEGCTIPDYNELFETYEDLGVNYGIIIDYLKDKNTTIESAKKAMEIYRSRKWDFKLMGVAQGNNKEEYLDCYRELKNIGYEVIAIGGMLKKRENSARYVNVRDESLLLNILSSVREMDKKGMVFALGCYSPKRHETFIKYSVFGSDYKGWIFQYNARSKKRGDKRAQKKRFSQVRDFVRKEVISKPQKLEERPKSKLLVVSCSKKKIKVETPTPAIYVYDGPVYKTLRKMGLDFKNENGLDILILSAKHGFIEPMTEITYYDQIMTKDSAEKMRPMLEKQLLDFLSRKEYSEIAVNLGKPYMLAFQKMIPYLSEETKMEFFDGPIGKKLHKTKKWVEKNIKIEN